MATQNTAQELWSTAQYAPGYAREKLQTSVRSLGRARHRQILVSYLSTGLCIGLILACVVVLIIRLTGLDYPLSYAVFGCLAMCLLLATLFTMVRKPDDLEVAILADVAMNLQQRFSTAWEFLRRPNPIDTDQQKAHQALGDALAIQAIRARLPTRSAQIFSPNLNNWARLSPIFAALLLLFLTLDLQPLLEPEPPPLDSLLVSQGQYLREYAQRMQTQARNEHLPRSMQQAQQMQRLGSRMENSALPREQALSRLRQLGTSLDEQRQAALREAATINAGQQQVEPISAPEASEQAALRSLLEDLAEGRVAADETKLSESDKKTLQQLGISTEQLEQALDDLQAGDEQALQRIADAIANSERAARDSEALQEAQQALDQIRENLGDDSGSGQPNRTEADPAEISYDDNSDSQQDLDGVASEDHSSEPGGQSATGRRPGKQAQQDGQQGDAFEGDTQQAGEVIKPNSQEQEGAVYSSTAQILPSLNTPTLDSIAHDHRFSAQLEQVLSKQDVPLHQKEFIRDYFLTLSQGVSASDTSGNQE